MLSLGRAQSETARRIDPKILMALEERAYCLSCLPDVAQLQLLQSALRTVQNALAERDGV